MRAARRAWPIIATSAAKNSDAHTGPDDTGLVAFSGNGARRRAFTRINEKRTANIVPPSVPAITGRRPELNGSLMSSRGLAPRAARIPNSRVLLVTEYPTDRKSVVQGKSENTEGP